MAKILVLSDSHGAFRNMVRAVEIEKPNRVFFLGDGFHDAERLQEQYPELSISMVPGNCDHRSDVEPEQTVMVGGFRMLLCHGHTYRVKTSLLLAGFAAEEQDLDLFLYGHTHRPNVDMRGKCWFMNPGSIGDRFRPFYGIVTVENGKLDCRTVELKKAE